MPPKDPSSWLAHCFKCNGEIWYRSVHCGFADRFFAYCDTCGRTAFLDGWFKGIPKQATFEGWRIAPGTEPLLQPCPCGGTFRAAAVPRCPHCRAPLGVSQFITLEGADWNAFACVLIEDHVVYDNWRPTGEVQAK